VILSFDDELQMAQWCEAIWPGRKTAEIRMAIERRSRSALAKLMRIFGNWLQAALAAGKADCNDATKEERVDDYESWWIRSYRGGAMVIGI
jgi:hypothetical protein